MREFLHRYKKPVGAAAALLFWLLVWQIAAMAYGMDFILPSPVGTLRALAGNVVRPAFWGEIAYSVAHILLGFLIASLLGIVLAFAGIRVPAVRVLFDPFCSVIRAVPVASFIILVLVMFPVGVVSTVISSLMGFPVIYASVSAGLDASPRALLEVTRVYGMGYFRTLRCVYLPYIRPALGNALTVAAGLCFKSGIAAEVIGVPSGSAGASIFLSKVALDMPALFSYTVVLVLVSVLTEKCLSRLLSGRAEKGRGTER